MSVRSFRVDNWCAEAAAGGVEGIHPRERTWHQAEVSQEELGFGSNSLVSILEEAAAEERDLLHRRFDRFAAYKLKLEGLRRSSSDPQHPALQGWASEWLGREGEYVAACWDAMAERLAIICEIPLTDSRWDEDFSRFSWIAPQRMTAWMTERPIGMANAYRHRWVKRLFHDAFSRAVTHTHAGLSMDRLCQQIRCT